MTIENTGTENEQQQQNTNDAANEPLHVDFGGETSGDTIIDKHLDMALEAQDGKKQDASAQDAQAAGGNSQQGQAQDANQQAAAGQDSNSNGKNNNQQQQAQQKGSQEKGSASSSGPQDLVLKGQGPNGSDLVVKGGAERRFYEKLQVERGRAQLLEGQLQTSQQKQQQLQQQLDTMQQTVQSANGLSPTDLGNAVRLFNDFRKDPMTAVRNLLAEMTAKGYKIDGIAPGVDIEAIKSAVRAELGASIGSQNQQQVNEEQIRQEAQAEANQFFSRYPDARQHEPLIAKVMHDHPGVDVYTVYFKLRDSFIEQGFDWNRPLDAQLQERAASSQQQDANTQQQQQQQNNGPGLPTNRGTAQVPANSVNDVAKVAHESASKDDIIKEAMREAGMNI